MTVQLTTKRFRSGGIQKHDGKGWFTDALTNSFSKSNATKKTILCLLFVPHRVFNTGRLTFCKINSHWPSLFLNERHGGWWRKAGGVSFLVFYPDDWCSAVFGEYFNSAGKKIKR